MIEFRRQVGEFINQTYYAGKTFILTKGEKKVAALVPVSVLDRLTELEAFYKQAITDRQLTSSLGDEITQTNEGAVQ